MGGSFNKNENGLFWNHFTQNSKTDDSIYQEAIEIDETFEL
jgi:hypothetical protein